MRLACISIPKKPRAETSWIVPVGAAPAAAEVSSTPKPPRSTLIMDLLIPRHMMSLRSVPLEVIKAPLIVSKLLDNMNPAALVARPLKAFSKETTTGISAPPIGRTMFAPKQPQILVFMSKAAVPQFEAYTPGWVNSTASVALVAKHAKFNVHRTGSMIGRPGRIPCSFPQATRLPVYVKDPTAVPKNVSNAFNFEKSPGWKGPK
mmetsp:Transcript_58660/g.107269  ORF Transcript_58660/g.107269 Transcript_58660/m.107269 type:complete len:205 (-) Transcript_58660:1280-1894(-)